MEVSYKGKLKIKNKNDKKKTVLKIFFLKE